MNFLKWMKWENRSSLNNLDLPGIYAIAKSKSNIENKQFHFISEIIYVGMTNSKSGLRNRLKQFDDTLRGKRENHGGAQRVRFKYPNYPHLLKNLYVSVRPFQCDASTNKFNDLLIMGEVVKREYVCLAYYVKKFNRLPEFNDKKRSPKK